MLILSYRYIVDFLRHAKINTNMIIITFLYVLKSPLYIYMYNGLLSPLYIIKINILFLQCRPISF